MPMTAAALPSPAATAKIKTHKIVGTARIKATKPLIILVTRFGAKFWAASNPKNKAIMPPNKVVKNARPIVITTS